jgi:3-oxoadipate enol-lactonase
LACSRYDLRHQVNQVRTPTWVAVGSDDGLTPLSYTRYLATNIPDVHLLVVPDAGHMLILEQPDAVAFGLNQFLGETFFRNPE